MNVQLTIEALSFTLSVIEREKLYVKLVIGDRYPSKQLRKKIYFPDSSSISDADHRQFEQIELKLPSITFKLLQNSTNYPK